jgi:pSer/pThr/pTyr-binding forkhead associated (FHA) protein
MGDKTKNLPKALKVAPGSPGQPLSVELQRRKTILIGRGSDCDLVVKDPKASRHHCRLTREETSLVLEDLGSKNGTFVDGERIQAPVALKPNQTFKVGDTLFYLAS